jgi:putative MATE family efflux protein
VTLAAGYAFADTYMGWIGADDATRAAGRTFLHGFVPGLALQFPMVVMSSALRGTGIVKPAMIVQMLTVLLNAGLAPILIAGWGTGHPLGVAGAGLATSLAALAGNVVLATYFVRLEKYVAFDSTQWKPRVAIWKRLAKVGIPAGGEFFAMALFSGTVYWITGRFGTAAQAGFGVGTRIMQMVMLPAMAVAFAAAPIAGQNFGARAYERVRETFRISAVASCAIMVAVTLACQYGGEAMARIFTSEPAVVDVSIVFLSIISWNFLAMGLVFTCSSMFQALGNTLPSLLSMGFRLLTFAIPGIWLSRHAGFELRHLWYLSVATAILQAMLSVALLRRELRMRLR